MHNGNSIVALVKELKEEAKVFVREEFQLAKKEISEKLIRYGKDSVGIVVGGALAYAALPVFLMAVGAVIAYAFEAAGLGLLLAVCVGFGIISLLAMVGGGMMALAGIKAAKQVSPTPERTVRTLQQLSGAQPLPGQEVAVQVETKDERSPEQVEASVLVAEAQMADTLEALAEKVSLDRVRRRVTSEVRTHPYKWGLIAAGCGAAGSYVLKRKLTKAMS